MRGRAYRHALVIFEVFDLKRYRLALGRHQFDRISDAKSVALRQNGIAVFVAFLNDGADLGVGIIARFGIMLAGVTVVKAGAVRSVAELIDLVYPDLRQLFDSKTLLLFCF